MKDEKQKEVVVLGQRRSGTSMVAGILYHLGVPMGEKATPAQVSVKNKHGFFEDRNIIEVSEEMLVYTEEMLSKGKKITLAKLHLKFGKKTRDVIEERRKQAGDIWGFKDVNQINLHNLYKRYLNNPYYIFVYRNPIDIANSLHEWHKENGVSVTDAIKATFENYSTMMGYWQMMEEPIFHFSFEAAKEDPEKVVNNIIKFLDIKPKENKIKKAINHIK